MRFTLLFFTTMAIAELCFSQSTSDPKPLPPTFQRLTLDPGSGIPTLFWTPPAYNPLNPDPTGYIIYKRIVDEFGNVKNEPVDTVAPSRTSYTDMRSSGLSEQIRYTIASNGPTEPSPLTAHHGSILLTANYDSCSNEIDLNWLHYVGWGNRIDTYEIFLGEQRDWNDLPLVGTISGNQNSFSYPVEPNSSYLMYVRAKKEGSDLISRSNSFFVRTRMARWPEFIRIDSVLAYDNQTDIHFTIDEETEQRNFAIYRWSVPLDDETAIFREKKLVEFTDPATKSFSDNVDSWDARSRPFYYRVNSYDGCKRIATVSDTVNSIPLRVITRGTNNQLIWDTLYYSDLYNKNYSYKIFRLSYGDNTIKDVLIPENPKKITFDDDISDLEGQGLSTKFCYYVDATELGEENQVVVLSRTRLVCTEVIPEIVMPNAIDPLSTQISLSGNNARNYFAPIISFNSDFKLTIYNRWGGIVFVGENEGWNGLTAEGELAKEGSYIYRLEVHSESNRVIVKTGYLTVMYGPTN